METTICTLVSLKDEKYKDVKNKLHDDPRKEVLSPHFFWLFEWLTLKWTKETPHRYWTIHWSSTITTKYLKEERKRNFFSKQFWYWIYWILFHMTYNALNFACLFHVFTWFYLKLDSVMKYISYLENSLFKKFLSQKCYHK